MKGSGSGLFQGTVRTCA